MKRVWRNPRLRPRPFLAFLEYCLATGQGPTFMALNMLAHEGDIVGGEDGDRTGNRAEVVPKE